MSPEKSSPNANHYRWLWFALALLVVGMICAAIPLHTLFIRSTPVQSSAWSSSISASSSILLVIVTAVLVGVTATYVLQTRRLVDLQGDFAGPIRVQQRLDATKNVFELMVRAESVIRTSMEAFPLSSTTPNPLRIIGASDMNVLSWELSLQYALLPQEMHHSCKHVIDALNMAYRCQNALYESVRIAMMMNTQAPLGEEPRGSLSWTDVEYQINQLRNPDVTWTELFQGVKLSRAADEISSLTLQVTDYLGRDH